MLKKVFKIGLASLALATVVAGAAQSATYTFLDFDGVNDGGPGIVPQIQLDVTQVGSDALFFFQNLGPLASSITHIVFSDPANILNLRLSIDNSHLGVDFAASAQNMPQWVGLEEFGIRATSPRAPNGVQPNEYLGVTFSLSGSFASLISALDAGTFDVVMHVQQTRVGEGSDVLVSTTLPTVPVPATGLLLIGALGGMAALRRRRTPA